MTLAMGWDEWARHDAVALAERLRRGDLSAPELAQQVAAGVAKLNPLLSAVVELFDDAVAAPSAAGTPLQGFFAGVPSLVKDRGPTLKGRLQEMGSLFMRGNRAGEDRLLTGRMRRAGLLAAQIERALDGRWNTGRVPATHVTRV